MILRPKFGLWAVKIVIDIEDEKGRIKKVTEEHLYDAVNPTDAEKQATAEMDGTFCVLYIPGSIPRGSNKPPYIK